MIKLAPSILSADFAHLADQIGEAAAAGADYIHVDVMDGHFVPNLTIGPLVVEAARRSTALPLDVHLMIAAPERYVERFAQAGADIITVHAEACPHLHRVVQLVKQMGRRAGVALNPGTPLAALDYVLDDLDMAVIMTVNPGFGGQSFLRSILPKVEALRRHMDDAGLDVELEVDGGINAETAPAVVRAGGRVMVAGSAIYNGRETVAAAMARLRHATDEGRALGDSREGREARAVDR